MPDLRAAYALGAEKLDEVLEWCAEIGIGAVSLWVFSTDNFDRPPTEVSGILSAIESKLTRLAQHPRSHRLGLRVRAVGKLDLLPDSTLAAIRAAEEATASNRTIVLTFAVAYGGRQEIIDAVQAMLREKSKQGEDLQTIIDGVTEETIGQHPRPPTCPTPTSSSDSGEIRLSGFLLWQSAYSEFYSATLIGPPSERSTSSAPSGRISDASGASAAAPGVTALRRTVPFRSELS